MQIQKPYRLGPEQELNHYTKGKDLLLPQSNIWVQVVSGLHASWKKTVNDFDVGLLGPGWSK